MKKKKSLSYYKILSLISAVFLSVFIFGSMTMNVSAESRKLPYTNGDCEPYVFFEDTECEQEDVPALAKRSYLVESSTAGDSRDLFLKCAGQRWGYKELAKQSKGSQKQKFYDRIFDGMIDVWNNTADINTKANDDGYNYGLIRVLYTDLGLSKEEAKEIYFTFIYDNPIFYFVSKTYSSVGFKLEDGNTGNAIRFYTYKEYLSGKTRQKYQAEIKSFLAEADSVARNQSSAYYKALKLHDKVSSALSYNKVSGTQLYDGYYHASHNITGGITYGKGVCESYAKIYQMIGSYCGLESIYVVGKGRGNSGSLENHAWNVIKLDDGNYYGADVTWDDVSGDLECFARGTTSFDRKHITQSAGWSSDNQYFYTLPENMPKRDFDRSNARNHIHIYGSWRVQKNATCTAAGTEVRTCITCGHTDTRSIDMKPHTFTDKKVAATCTTDGYTEHKCSVCGYTAKDTIVKAKGHNYTEKVVPPTTEQNGYTEHTCTRCGDTYRDHETPKLVSDRFASVKLVAGNGENTDVKAVKVTVLDSKGAAETEATADENGIVTPAKQLTDGDHTAVFSMEGFAPRSVAFTVKYGKASLGEIKLCRYGDLNGDGIVNLNDLGTFQQIICEWDVNPVYIETGDFNKNGMLEMNELGMLQQYLCGWDIKLGE